MTRKDGVVCPEKPFIQIQMQDGPVGEVGVNGCQIDDVVKWCVSVLQQLNANFPCRENSLVITKLEEAGHWLEHRTKDRKGRGVEGANLP
jgi:hypothetical protein